MADHVNLIKNKMSDDVFILFWNFCMVFVYLVFKVYSLELPWYYFSSSVDCLKCFHKSCVKYLTPESCTGERRESNDPNAAFSQEVVSWGRDGVTAGGGRV